MQNLLFITSSLGQGGAERMLFLLLRGLDRSHFKIKVISLRPGGAYVPQLRTLGIDVQEFNFGLSPRRFHQLLNFSKAARTYKADLVIGWMYHGNLFATVAGLLTRAEVIWNVRHSLDDLAGDRLATRLVIRICAALSNRCRRIIFNSARSMRAHIAIGYSEKHSITIANGIDTAHFIPKDKGSIRRTLGIPDSAKVIGMVARVHSVKDHATTLRAVAALNKGIPDVWLVLVGLDTDGEWISNQLKDLGIQDKTLCLGARLDTEQIYPALDLLCSSSKSEGFPNVIAEAMSCGVPCIATDVGESSEIVGELGAIVKVGDAEAICNEMYRFFTLSDERRNELKEQNRTRIISKFSLNAMIDAYSEQFSID